MTGDNREGQSGLPVAERVARPPRLPWRILLLLAVLAWGGWVAYNELASGRPFSFQCENVHRIRPGSDVLLNNRRIGEVRRVEAVAGSQRCRVVCRLDRDQELSERVLRDSSIVRIKRLEVVHLRVKSGDSLVRPPAVWIELGDPQAGVAEELVFREETPIEDARLRWDSVRATVRWKSVYDLQYGDRVLDHDGSHVGYVVGVKADRSRDTVSVELAFLGGGGVDACPYARAGTRYHIGRFETRRLKLQGEDTPFFGTKVVVLQGDPQGPPSVEFVGQADPPPHPAVRWNSRRIAVLWKDVHGLEYGAPVLANGVQIGMVETIRPEANGRVRVGLVFFETDSERCPYECAGTEYWVKRFASERLEIQGGEQALLGSVVLVTAGDPAGPAQSEFTGREEVPTEKLPGWDAQRVVVFWDYLWDLETGAPVLSNGRRVGIVDQVEREANRWKVTLAFDSASEPPLPETREGARFHIGRFGSERLQLQWADAALRGPSVVVVPGDPAGEPLAEFEGRAEPPPHPRVRWDSVRVAVYWSDVHGLRASAPVRAGGSQVGEVEAIEYERESGLVRADLVFFATKWESCPYVRVGTRYYPNMARLGPRGVEGEASTALYGAHVDVIPDPLYSRLAIVAEFRGADSPPPMYRPRPGEQEIYLNSARAVRADTPLHYYGELAGYVHTVKQVSDSKSWELRVRVYPRFQQLIRTGSEDPGTVFFLEKGMEADFSWFGGSFEMDPSAMLRQAMLRQAIEFRTKQDSGRPVAYTLLRPPRFQLHLLPEDEWLDWKASMPIETSDDAALRANRVPKPRPLRVAYKWRHRLRPLVSWHEHQGLVLPLDNGLLGPAELLQPTVDEDRTTKALFKVGGRDYVRGKPYYRNIAPGLVFMEFTLPNTTSVWPVKNVGFAQRPIDVWIAVAPGDVRAIERSSFTLSKDRWHVDTTVGCLPTWHGAPAVDRSNGHVVGVLLCHEGPDEAAVAPFPRDIVERLRTS